jgi:hypothetical protein
MAYVVCEGKGVTLQAEADSGEFAGQTRTGGGRSGTRRWPGAFAIVDDAAALIVMSVASDARFETAAQLACLPAWDALWTS